MPLFATLLLVALPAPVQEGRVVLLADEWALSDRAYQTDPLQTRRLARGIASVFANGGAGNFLVLSNIADIPSVGARGVQGALLALDMQAAGHTWTIDPGAPITAAHLDQYDGVYLAGGIASGPTHAPQLVQYVQNGGCVLLMAGVGGDASYACTSAACEAQVWNHFLNAFGLALGPQYYGVASSGQLASLPVLASDSPLAAGVTSLIWGNGQPVIDLEPLESSNWIALRADFTALGGGPQGIVNGVVAAYNVQGPIGMSTCAGVPNSTGQGGLLTVVGSTFVVDNAVVLRAERLPANSFGYFLTSAVSGFVAQPGGSQGNLCLGGAIGRYSGNVLGSGAAGSFSLGIDPSSTPTPTGSVTIAAGQTWHYQCWHRDANPQVTSNFTGAVGVTYR